MPTVTKHSSNNLVTVSYPVREAVLDITHAEHALILMFSHEKDKMIKFIRAQYNLELYEAKPLVDTVIASAEVKPEAKPLVDTVIASAEVKPEAKPDVQLQGSVKESVVDWSTVPAGTMIYVKDWLYEDWYKREFIRYNPDSVFSFVCKSSDDDTECVWQRAKLTTC